MIISAMLFDRDNGALFNRLLVRVVPISNHFIPLHKGNDVFLKHVGARSLVCILKGFKVLPDVNKGLLRVCKITLGLVLMVEVIVVILFPCPLEV